MKKNVFVFPCGSEIGLEAYRSLNTSTHFNVFGGSSVDDHGRFVYENYIDGVPFVDEPNFIEHINGIIRKYKINFILPAHDSVVLKLAEAAEAGKLQCTLVSSKLETCQISRSKLKSYEFLKDKISVPRVYKNASDVSESDFPVFLKPDVGQGSKGVFLAKNKTELDFYISRSDLLILENLPGNEFTVDCFTNKNGKLMYASGRERTRIQNGISVSSKTVDDSRISKIANKINESLKFRGMWFFQVKENAAKELVLLEIAPRLAGTTALDRSKGVNLPLLSLFDASGNDVTISQNDYRVEIDRALENKYKLDLHYNHVYLDFDDMVIYEDQVNPKVMAFVFQCLNNGKKIHLITRHKYDLEASLEKYRLDGIFDEVIHITDGSEKHTKMSESSAIFIDDSFAERLKASRELSIPTFDAHMLEVLMEN